MTTTSQELSAKALEFYKSSQRVGLAPILKRDYLEKAVNIYSEALRACPSSEHDQYLALHRNVGTSCSKISETINKQDHEQKLFWISKAVSHLSTAFKTAQTKGGRTSLWLDKVTELIEDCGENAGTAVSHLPYQQRVNSLYKFSFGPEISGSMIEVKILEQCANVALNSAVVKVEAKEFVAGSSCLNDCMRFSEEALARSRKLGDVTRVEGIYDARDRCEVMLCICESMKEITTGDKLLQYALAASEEMKVDLVWDVIDKFKQAVLLTREKDIESEAIALSKLGSVFLQAFKMKDKAHDYYRRSFDLAQSLLPRDLSSQKWYKETCDALKKFQEEATAEEDAKRAAEREPILQELKNELDKLKEQSKHSATRFLEYLIKEHPPKLPNVTINSKDIPTQPDLLRKEILKFITYYHPDKQQALPQKDRKWEVFCEEITKYLNKYYSFFK